MSTGGTGIELSKVVDVGGTQYIISHQAPTKAWELGIQLMKIVGEPIAGMAQAGESADSAAAALPAAVGSLMANIKPGESMNLIKGVLASVSTTEGDKAMLSGPHFDLHFRGRLGHMMHVFGAAVEFQFEDFFSAIGDAIASAMKKALPSASQSQPTSVGQ